MPRPHVERAFERYRATRDPAWLAAVFDATATDLLHLARHFVPDAHAAEDLVQATFLTAIEDADSFAPEREVMPWLCGILANRARELHRRRRRPPPTEALARLDLADPEAEASLRELDTTVQATIRGLPEPYRQVLLLHLAHGLSGREIADALARPDATVRSQLHRGLDLLRKALPIGLAGAARAMAGNPDLGAVRAAVLGPAAAVPTILPLATFWTMKKLLTAASALLVLTLGSWFLFHDGGAAPPPFAGGAAAAGGQVGGPVRQEIANETATSREAASAPAPNAKASLAVEVVWSDGTPAAGVGVRVYPRLEWQRSELAERTTTSDAAGRARFDDLPPGRTSVCGDRSGNLSVELVAGQGSQCRLEIARGIRVHGVVVDAAGRAAAGAQVLFRNRWHVDAQPLALCDGIGAFELRDVPFGASLGASLDDRVATQGVVVPDSGTAFECRLQLGEAGATVEGTVCDTQGRPIAGATVLVAGPQQMDVTAQWMHLRGTGAAARTVRTDGDGHFVVRGLPRFEHNVWAAAPEFACWFGKVDTKAPPTLRIVLLAGATVRGTVHARGGEPAAEATIRAHAAVSGSWQDGLLRGPSWALPAASTRADGSYELRHVTPGASTVRVEQQREHLAKAFTLADGEVVTWDPWFGTGPRLAGVLVDPSGEPLGNWRLMVRDDPRLDQKTDGFGRFDLAVEDGPHDLWFVPPGVDIAAWRVRGVRPQTEPLRVEVPWARLPSAHLTGEVLDADGVPAPAQIEFLMLHEDGSSRSLHASSGADGRFTSGPLLPARYLVRASLPGAGTLRAGPFRVGDRQTADTSALRFQRPGSLTLRTPTAKAPDSRPMRILYRAATEPTGFGAELKDGELRLGSLQPGTWFVTTSWPATTATWRCEVASDQETTVDLDPPNGVECRVRWLPIPVDDYLLHVVFRDARGAIAAELFGINDFNERGYDLPMRLAPGKYMVEVEDGAGRTASAPVEIHAAEPPMVVPLPTPGAK